MTENISTRKITPFQTFEGEAEAAMNFYTSLFSDSEVVSITRTERTKREPKGQ